MTRDVNDFLKTGKRPSTNTIIWEEEKIYDLVAKICNKTETREKIKNKKSVDDNEINSLAKDYDNKTKNRRKNEEEIGLKTEMIKKSKKSKKNYRND